MFQTLNMAGNGFYGTIVSALPTDSLLKDLTLSHNRLTGTLSVAMQHWPFRKLDLSYNRLTGELQHITNYGAVYDDNITEIILKVRICLPPFHFSR